MVIKAYRGITGIGVSTPAAAGVAVSAAAVTVLAPAALLAVMVKEKVASWHHLPSVWRHQSIYDPHDL